MAYCFDRLFQLMDKLWEPNSSEEICQIWFIKEPLEFEIPLPSLFVRRKFQCESLLGKKSFLKTQTHNINEALTIKG